MTEQEWLECADPQPMLEHLRGTASDRKSRLFACACCRRLWNLLSDKYCRNALKIAERYADAEVSEDKLGFVWGDARRAAQVVYRQERETAEASAMWAVSMACEADIGKALAAVGQAALCEGYPIGQASLTAAKKSQLVLLRDIFGNPFRLSSIDASWLTPAVTALAQSIYDERAFDRLPIIADELEKAGCGNQDILDHCRGTGPHVRGCWALDLVLRKK